MSHKSEAEYIANTHNTARFFTENRQLSLVLLIAVCVWGWYGYQHMPKRKDPKIPVRVAVAYTQWPGATAEEVEQLVTRQVEQTMAQNSFHQAAIGLGLWHSLDQFSRAFAGLRAAGRQGDRPEEAIHRYQSQVNALNSKLPQGAGPIQFNSDFGDTAALMLTVASPPANEVD